MKSGAYKIPLISQYKMRCSFQFALYFSNIVGPDIIAYRLSYSLLTFMSLYVVSLYRAFRPHLKFLSSENPRHTIMQESIKHRCRLICPINVSPKHIKGV